MAKGRLLGIQFDTLFTDDLYFKIAAHANKLAMKLKMHFLKKDIKCILILTRTSSIRFCQRKTAKN